MSTLISSPPLLPVMIAAWFLTAWNVAAQTLAEAVNAPAGAVVTSGGTRVWTTTTTTSRDGVAVRSGAINHNQSSWLQMSITGPGILHYWRKVSTEPDFDYLRVYLNGQELTSHAASGTSDWLQQSVFLVAGTNLVRWEFSKDEADDEAGANTVWLDQITLVPANEGRPSIALAPPARKGGEAGWPFTLLVGALGEAPLAYQWRRGGQSLSLQTEPQLSIPLFGAGHTGSYDCVISNSQDSVTTAPTVVSLISHGPALDHVQRGWCAQGDAFWTSQNMHFLAGESALRSGLIADKQRSEFSATFTGPGTIRYWRKLSTEEGFDFLSVRVNGQLVHHESGLRDWEQASLTLPVGTAEVSWSYEKNERFTFGEDAVWIDSVIFLQGRQAWLDSYFTTVQQAAPHLGAWGADPNGNGLANAFEYLFGLNPVSAEAVVSPPHSSFCTALMQPVAGPNTGADHPGMAVSLPLSCPDDVVLTVEYSPGLGDAQAWMPLAQKIGNAEWTPLNGALVVDAEVSLGLQLCRVFHPAAVESLSGAGFLRLKLEMP